MKAWYMNSAGATAALSSVMVLASLLVCGCGAKLPPLKTVDRVDIPRFMGA